MSSNITDRRRRWSLKPSTNRDAAATGDLSRTTTAASDDERAAIDDAQVRQDSRRADNDQVGVAAIVPGDVGVGHGSKWAGRRCPWSRDRYDSEHRACRQQSGVHGDK